MSHEVMRLSRFMLDALGERAVEGYAIGELWNGWAAPVFTFEQAQMVVSAWREQGWAAHYDEDGDVFVFSVNQDFETGESDESEEYPAVEQNGVKYYGIGTCAWTWEEEENPSVLA